MTTCKDSICKGDPEVIKAGKCHECDIYQAEQNREMSAVERLVSTRRGLPGNLEQEIYDALRPIILKYRKTYLGKGCNGKDRIYGILTCCLRDCVKKFLY